jgi:hypothetical protein
MRSQLLAHCIESDPNSSVSRADFGVIYYAGNQDLLDMPCSFGGERNPFVAWRKMLQNADTFHDFTVQDLVKAVEPLPSALLPWRQYLKERYGL